MNSTTSRFMKIASRPSPMKAGGAGAGEENPKRAFAARLLTGREDARLDAVMENATQAHASLARIKPFWR